MKRILIKYIKVTSVLCLVLSFLCTQPAFYAGTDTIEFEDVKPSDWHYEYVMLLAEQGVLKGMTPTSFEPSGKLTVAQLFALTARYLGLEEVSADLQKISADNNIKGTDNWFYGYVSALYECGVVDNGDFGIKIKDGRVVIDTSSKNALNSPVKRADAAKIVAKSFEIPSEKELIAGNMPWEVSRYGYDFIVGGGYDDYSLEKYAVEISDYDKIPEDLRQYVAKCYYNGIFNGYEDGSFNPDGLLTRAEASKIISVITHYGLRERTEHRDLPPTALVSEKDFYIDHNGITTLQSNIINDILWQISLGLTLSEEGMSVKLDNIIPMGYSAEIQVFNRQDGSYEPEWRWGLFTSGANRFPQNYTVQAEGERSVLIYLRNLSAGGRVDGIYELVADSDGKVISTCYDIRQE